MAKTAAEAYMQQGELAGRRAMLIELLETRFMTIPDALRDRINSITDLDSLRAVAREVVAIEKLDDLRL